VARPNRSPIAEEKRMTTNETYKGEFYCVKCKEKRQAEGKVVVSENGRRMAKAVCPVCGTNLNRILGKA
jgi:Zn finger protein HypA/HybF involved in hydrogenase expression